MMRNNRKHMKVDGFLFPAPVTTVVAVLSAVALAYIWLGCQCESVGRKIKALEADRMALKQQLSNEQAKWAEMKSIENIDRMLARHALAMQAPRPGQVIRLRGKFYDGWHNLSPDANKYARLDRTVVRHE